MAVMIVNSTETKAVRKESVIWTEIVPRNEQYELVVRLNDSSAREVVFEEDATEEGIGTKAAALITALES